MNCCDPNQPPATLMAGAQITFTADQYSVADYTLQFAFNNGVDAPTVVSATVVGDVFSVTATAPTKPGNYSWGEVYTKNVGGAKFAGRSGTTKVTPNPLATATPSTAQTILTQLEAALTSGNAATGRTSASFNGQSVSWSSPVELQNAITYWRAVVLAEQRAARGEGGPVLMQPIFVQPNFRC